MTIDHIFFGFMTAVGIAAGAVLIAMPETREARVPPYFWVLIAMILFEVTLFAFYRGVPGRMVRTARDCSASCSRSSSWR